MDNTLGEHLEAKDVKVYEGHSGQCERQQKHLRELVSGEGIVNLMEIGFNGGHSAELFLSSNENVNVVSFDIGKWECVEAGKKFIDAQYPGRHELVLGDSVETVVRYTRENPGKTFDLIFIDGGHDYKTAKADLVHCRALAHQDTIVIMDDTMTELGQMQYWNIGPNIAWMEGQQEGFVEPLGSVVLGPEHGLSWGRYVV